MRNIGVRRRIQVATLLHNTERAEMYVLCPIAWRWIKKKVKNCDGKRKENERIKYDKRKLSPSTPTRKHNGGQGNHAQ